MTGKVWLVGAGPGDAGLMTLRGKEVLQDADVVVYDALVGNAILGMIPERAELIFAGKRAGNHYLKQSETNKVLLEEALKGKKVVRLKGGDPFLFGRGGEELELLVENDVPFEIVPGITSAISVPAYNGIPVTHRDFCSSVHIITGHKRANASYDIDFEALVRTQGTLIFLMGITAMPDICAGLIDAGMDPDTPAAVLEKGTTSGQRKVLATVATLKKECDAAEIGTPAIIVVGKVTSVSETFAWQEKRPLFGVRAIVTRPKELTSGLSDLLRSEGAEVLELPAIRTAKAEDTEPELEEAIAAIKEGSFDWIVFTSPSGVRIFMEELFKIGDVRMLGGTKIAVIGQGTKKALAKYGIRADFIPTVFDGGTLGKELAQILPEGSNVLIPRARIGNAELIEELKKVKGVSVTDLATYDTVYVHSQVIDEASLIGLGEPGVKSGMAAPGLKESVPLTFCVFTSASTVKGFAEAVQSRFAEQGGAGAEEAELLAGVRAVCIGRQTAEAAQEYGMRTWTAEKATLTSLAECLAEAAAECRQREEND